MGTDEERDALGDELRDEKPDGVDLQALKWQADIASRLFGTDSPEIRIGRYLVLERIGDGASGVVYSARDPELDRTVAIKLLRPDAALPEAQADAWLSREAKTLARLSHPNVLPVYDVGTHDGQVFMYPRCMFMLMAGGGMRGGQVIGESDETASGPKH
ncbi:MAG: protein kinase, partial [Myxococcota bacterium]